MKKIQIEPRYIVDNSGKKREVILDIKIFEKILEKLEDAYLIKCMVLQHCAWNRI